MIPKMVTNSRIEVNDLIEIEEEFVQASFRLMEELSMIKEIIEVLKNYLEEELRNGS